VLCGQGFGAGRFPFRCPHFNTMSFSKRTVNERLATALRIADENNRRLAVRMAKIEAAVTAICQATGIELEFENPEIEEAAKAMLGIDPPADAVAQVNA